MKIKYLYNSGFSLETENYLFVFDYFKDSAEGTIKDHINCSKNIIVFCSHSHGDHFNPEIFEWRKQAPCIKYVLSSDIMLDFIAPNIYFMSSGQEFALDGVFVKAYGSTDLGVSFVVKFEDNVIFHAGDLNCWYWFDESPEENQIAEAAFKQEVEKLKADWGGQVDIAFFPVDPRLKDKYDMGVRHFVKEIKPSWLVPMHFGDHYQAIEGIEESLKKLDVKILNPEKLV